MSSIFYELKYLFGVDVIEIREGKLFKRQAFVYFTLYLFSLL